MDPVATPAARHRAQSGGCGGDVDSAGCLVGGGDRVRSGGAVCHLLAANVVWAQLAVPTFELADGDVLRVSCPVFFAVNV